MPMRLSNTTSTAGNATFTVSSPDGTHRTYRVEKVEATVCRRGGELLVFDDDANDLRARDSACALDFDPGAVILLAR